MKLLSRKSSLAKLREIKNGFRSHISQTYEHRAKSCLTCETKGACCLDAHFVNVRISRLEADAISEAISDLKSEIRDRLLERSREAISRYRLDEAGDGSHQTYACPLFDKTLGCVVHDTAKPLPCIAHACYEKRQDLPPDHLVAEQEAIVEGLNVRTYGGRSPRLPIPLAISSKK